MTEEHATTTEEGAGVMPAPSRVVGRRAAWVRRRRRRAAIVAATSTIVVVAALFVAVTSASGWPRVRTLFFNGERFRKDFPEILGYLWVDVKLFLQCIPFILAWGLTLALFRNARSPILFPLRLFAAAYTDAFRGIPVVLTIYLVGFGIPALGIFEGRITFLGLGGDLNSVYLWGPIALVLAYSAYVAEVFRSGIESVHESQRAGARSLGLSQAQTLRHVVVPQAARRVVPPLMNDFLSLQKDVALLSFLGIIDVFRRAQSIKDLRANYTPYVVAAIIFLCLTVPLTRFVDWYAARQRRRTSGSVVV
jgi:polar amino acid transport system permease protein